jgi:hypothetical protein
LKIVADRRSSIAELIPGSVNVGWTLPELVAFNHQSVQAIISRHSATIFNPQI